MRFSAVAAALAASPALVSAAKGYQGFALGTKRATGECKSQQDYAEDFDAIKSESDATIVRGYAASECDMAKNCLPAAKAKGFKVVLGIWPDVEESFQKDLKAITDVAQEYADTIHAVTVGSETLYRGNFTGAQLKDKVSTVKSALPGSIKVGIADTWNRLMDGTADDVIPVCDIIMINAFAFWQGASKDKAIHVYFDDLFQAMTHIEKVAKSSNKELELCTGETGWPTAVGTDYGDAKGGPENAADFYRDGLCAMINYGYNAFYFEAFDEPWKQHSVGESGKAADETTWGAMNAKREKKFELKCKMHV